MYNFKRLIKKYSKYNDIIYPKVVGSKIDMSQGGKIIEDIEYIKIDGAVVSKKENLNYDTGGVGVLSETLLYTYDYIKDNSKVLIDSKPYTCMLSKDYSRFDKGLRIYKLESGVDG